MTSSNGFYGNGSKLSSNPAPPRRRFTIMQLLVCVVLVLYTPWVMLMIITFHRHTSTTQSTSDLNNMDASAGVGKHRLSSSLSMQRNTRELNDKAKLSDQLSNVSTRKNTDKVADSVAAAPIQHTVKEKQYEAAGNDASSTSPITLLSGFKFDKASAEKQISSANQKNIYFKSLMAYLEQPLNDTIPNTGKHGELENKKGADVGTPPQFITPLPRRLTTPSSLHSFIYPKVQSCNDLPQHLPVDRGYGNFITSNVNNQQTMDDPMGEAPYCPVDADPFLPWIHDVFPSVDGTAIHFVAQNKRRCMTGKRFIEELDRLQPQIALMQGVSVKRIEEEEAGRLAPDLWSPERQNEKEEVEVVRDLPRYKLATMEESDEDGQMTRFLCRFHTTDLITKKTVIVGETLSTYPFNYELVNKRKGQGSMLTPRGKDNQFFWLSNLRFDCPVPDNGDLRQIVASGDGVLSDGTATVYVDVVPIRTSPRFGNGEMYLTEDIAGKNILYNAYKDGWNAGGFKPEERWGDSHVLPLVEASGRWANIPVCKPPPLPPSKSNDGTDSVEANNAKAASIWDKFTGGGGVDTEKPTKKHTLAACVWASASFATRGNARTVTDTSSRLMEWLEFHLLAGFDHVYVYDNTGAHSNETSLESTLYPRFSKSEVTRIDWPSRVCNNNIPAHENTGERSSQYASESSCRQRYGQYTEWMASFDTDEYLIPMGDYTSMKDVVKDAEKKGTHILDFRSTRAYPSFEFTEDYYDGKECGKEKNPWCRQKKPDGLFLETYNCDMVPLPKPGWADRARKQIYRPDYVLSHYVHYSTVTRGYARTYKETIDEGLKWRTHYSEHEPIERVTDEINEAVMIHTKTTVPGDTTKWFERCKADFVPTHNKKCRVGYPYPENKVVEGATNDDGYAYNCFTNEKVTNYWLPRLHDAIKKRNEATATKE